MTFLQAAASPSGPAAACLRLLDDGLMDLLISAAVLAEVQNVLSRPKVRAKNPRLTDSIVEELLERLHKTALFIEPVPAVFTYPRDPKDEPYVNLAVAGAAGYLVTWDNDLLDLMTSSGAEGAAFRGRFPSLAILSPPAFLRAVSGASSASPTE
jgi:putative PIN family toxin of toxin-antitoxin system